MISVSVFSNGVKRSNAWGMGYWKKEEDRRQKTEKISACQVKEHI